ncbi:MAG: hypothetical protein GX974_05925 [Clostridiales bacterium]|nr:hypothetical protein [Clostridiales bacterium]
MKLGIREIIANKAKEAAKEYRKEFINSQQKKYHDSLSQYEEALTRYYELEIKLKFSEMVHSQKPSKAKADELKELKQEHILVLKEVKDIERSGILEEYDVVMRAIESIQKKALD